MYDHMWYILPGLPLSDVDTCLLLGTDVDRLGAHGGWFILPS